MVSTRSPKKGVLEIYPKFIAKRSKDLMIRGKDFYAIWDEQAGMWSTDADRAIYLIDSELDNYAKAHKGDFDAHVEVLHLWDTDTGMIDKWLKYVTRQLPDSYVPLDGRIIFANTETTREDYASKKLPYALCPCDISDYEELMNTLYSPAERTKIEWAIGSIISGDSTRNQKFIVLYGLPKSGKSTVLNIIEKLFSGYFTAFDAKSLASTNNSFALEAFRNNPLVAIQHDGDLSRIEDNTKLNSIVSHELMVVNEKFKSAYASRFNAFLFMGTNKPVKITDAKSGIIRRLIDVSPTNNRVTRARYDDIMAKIDFELGGIAQHCLDLYLSEPNRYDEYVPISMLDATNDFYNFIQENYETFKKQNSTTKTEAWQMYKEYCDEAKVSYPYSQKAFKEELKNYFTDYFERTTLPNGSQVRNYYSGFKTYALEYTKPSERNAKESPETWLKLTEHHDSLLDDILADCPAQYATKAETPLEPWDKVKTKMSDIFPRKLHYVKVPEHHIVIDFDIRDDEGNKSLERNIEAASKWPKTYAEVSKGGSGLHLHYIYEGDTSQLSPMYAPEIEIKTFPGNSSLRRKLSLCNDIPVATINSNLPLKGETKRMMSMKTVEDEKHLIALIRGNLEKKYHPNTKPSVDFIYSLLEDAYNSGMHYDVTSMRPDILWFASQSTNNADYCIGLVNKMHFKSDDISDNIEGNDDDNDIVFFDCEVFPNLFIICWKRRGEGRSVVRMINPTAEDVKKLSKYKLVGFNNRRYDNHICYARVQGKSLFGLFDLSQKIIAGSRNAMNGEAYNFSYSDIYDFSSLKQSLKKFEIDLKINHHELDIPWDSPVSEDLWDKVADYCCDDVVATEKVFEARYQDFIARKMLAILSGLTVNDSTRQHTTRIIFGRDEHPKLVYTDLSEMFPGYSFINGKSSYMGKDPGEGGRVYSEPGMYYNVALLDVESMHPHSIIALNLFGDYTKNFADIVQARMDIKHGDFKHAATLFDGKLAPFLANDEGVDNLAYALKIIINSVYGYTTAKFDNPFKDPRNVDNIVAKRGALFMMNLEKEVQSRGFTVAHIKTDSIKIPNATPEIIEFVKEYGKQYGYSFQHEATYKRMCLVNDAVYIAQYATIEECTKLYSENYVNQDKSTLKDNKKHPGEWTATGAEFQHPYIFKTLFSHEPVEFDDLCEVKTVSTAMYLDMNEGHEDEHAYSFVGKVGRFCPILPGKGGGILLRRKSMDKDEYGAVGGTKGYRWLESESVENLNMKGDIDFGYFNDLVANAVKHISEFGDFEHFTCGEDPPWDEEDGGEAFSKR